MNTSAQFIDAEVEQINVGTGLVTVHAGGHWAVLSSEYIDTGEPGVAIAVTYAFDANGTDIGEEVANLIVEALKNYKQKGDSG